MTNQLSTKIVKLDLDVILANYNKPAFWKKSWTIFKSDTLTLVAEIVQIDVRSSLITMNIKSASSKYYDKKARKQANISWVNASLTIPFAEGNEYTKEKFQSDLVQCCIRVIRSIETELIEKFAEYRNAKTLAYVEAEKLREIAEAYLDANNVTNSEIREGYIEYYIANASIPRYELEVIKNYLHTVIPHQYLMCAAFIGTKEHYDNIAKSCHKTRKSTKIKLWLKMQELNTDEYVEEMKSALPAILG
ncbi:MAG: hypothetical protein BWY97_00063 [Tenericutes bacterium ADurb.BinA124]|nr:MAG: hypothetical protein BWY97_00063 [Tenericutes bacterium ADurb.BinA124]